MFDTVASPKRIDASNVVIKRVMLPLWRCELFIHSNCNITRSLNRCWLPLKLHITFAPRHPMCATAVQWFNLQITDCMCTPSRMQSRVKSPIDVTGAFGGPGRCRSVSTVAASHVLLHRYCYRKYSKQTAPVFIQPYRHQMWQAHTHRQSGPIQ